jgi:uncharacterized OsmC-like protein
MFDADTRQLAFKLRHGVRPVALFDGAPAPELFKVEARHVGGHLREAVVGEGAGGSAWRFLSDEGRHLKGTDLAPFPFGYFNAGLESDLMRCLRNAAAAHGVVINTLELTLDNEYWLTGSFALGSGQGFAAPTRIAVRIGSEASAAILADVVKDAVDASPALALLRTPLTNTFALYINGRRRPVAAVAPSPATDAADPFLHYVAAPQATEAASIVAVEKCTTHEPGEIAIAPSATTTRITRKVTGRGRLRDASGLCEIETWLQLPGMSHFLFRTDESAQDRAPSGLALLAAGLAFCYMTQLARYVEGMKLGVGSIRLVQFSPFANGAAAGFDTHLFLNGDAPESAQSNLLSIAARTCYLHATMAASLPPQISVTHNGVALI